MRGTTTTMTELRKAFHRYVDPWGLSLWVGMMVALWLDGLM